MAREEAGVWDHHSGDDDVLLVEEDDAGVVSFIHANIVDTAVLKAPSRNRKKPSDDVDLTDKDPRARIPVNMEKGAVHVRKCKEATADGAILEGCQNPRRGARNRPSQKHWASPQTACDPLQWHSTAAVLGHSRMKQVDGMSLCFDRVSDDHKNLIDKFNDGA